MSPRCIKGHACDHPIACPTCFPPPTAASEMNRYVDAAEREAGENAGLRAEVRALRRERRALRKALRSVRVLLTPVDGSDSFERRRLREARDSVNEALKPRKARRAGRTK